MSVFKNRFRNNGTASAGPHESSKIVGALVSAAFAFTRIPGFMEFFRNLLSPCENFFARFAQPFSSIRKLSRFPNRPRAVYPYNSS